MNDHQTPRAIAKSLSDEELRSIGAEIKEWHATGKTSGTNLNRFSQRLMTEANMEEDGITQVAEAVTVREIVDRWLSFMTPQNKPNAPKA